MAWDHCCPRCLRFTRAEDLRCYDYRRGWLCVHCETPADRVV